MRRGSKVKRRSPGRGTLQTLPSGRIRASVTIEGRKITGASILPSDFPSLPEAQTEAFRLLQDRLDERSDSPRQSLSTYASAWLKRKGDERVSPTSLETWQTWINGLLQDPIASLAVERITKDDLDAFKGRFKGKPVTLRKRLAWLHQLLKEAGNPARAEMPRKEQSRRRPLSPQERKALAQRFHECDEELQLMILLTKEAMLRRSDAAGLKHEDRDGDGVYINRVVVKVKGKLVVKERAKSDRGNAWIPLSPELAKRIGNGRKGYVLGDGSRPVDPRRITNRIQHFARDLNIPYFGPHALRRTGGMELLESGVDIVTAAEIMRHDKTMLLEEYARSRRDLKLAAMEKVYGKKHRKEHGGGF